MISTGMISTGMISKDKNKKETPPERVTIQESLIKDGVGVTNEEVNIYIDLVVVEKTD